MADLTQLQPPGLPGGILYGDFTKAVVSVIEVPGESLTLELVSEGTLTLALHPVEAGLGLEIN